jgi:cytochrome oxidase Cu insertion factor (SCO1/SenC/PrrC family)
VASDLSDLQPAERDPVQLRRTGLTLAVIMVVGGIFVMAAYRMKLRADAKDERPNMVSRLTEKFGGRDQNLKAFTTSMLEDKITLITPISGKEKGRMAEALRVMTMVAAKFPEDDQLRFVGITVDPENDGPEQLRAMLAELGVADDPRWFFVQAEEKNAVGYLRNKLRLETEETVRIDGEQVDRFRSAIVLVEPNLHLLAPQYDFNVAREWQERARKLAEEDPEEAARRDLAGRTEEVRKAEESLLRSLEFIRKGDLKEGKKR